jgi:hypothetical protein
MRIARSVSRPLARMTLDGDEIEAIARRVAELLRGDNGRYLDAAGIARRYGVGRAWVYQHKRELGAVALGNGPKPRLRFDAARVEALLEKQRADREPKRRERTRRPRALRTPTGLPVLEYERSEDRAA